MTTVTDETIKEIEEYVDRPMCECAHAGPGEADVACEAPAEYEVTLLCPDDRCTALYLLCGSCRSEWVRNVPPPHRLLVRWLDAGW